MFSGGRLFSVTPSMYVFRHLSSIILYGDSLDNSMEVKEELELNFVPCMPYLSSLQLPEASTIQSHQIERKFHWQDHDQISITFHKNKLTSNTRL